jgi:hypothetical protein
MTFYFEPAAVERVRATNSVALVIPNNAVTALALDTNRYDSNGLHDVAVNNTRLTCKRAGLYVITGHAQFAASAAGTLRILGIRLNGNQAGGVLAAEQFAPVAVDFLKSVSTEYVLAVNDYLELYAFQDSGGNLNVLKVNQFSPEFAMAMAGG